MNLIREAASRLPGHWHKGSMTDGNGNHCALGHLWEVSKSYEDSDVERWRAFPYLDKVAIEQYPDRVVDPDDHLSGLAAIAQLNDHPATTEDEIVAVMEKAAILLDEDISG